MANPTKIPNRFSGQPDKSLPRISEPFATDFLEDINALTKEDYITIREVLAGYLDEELEVLKESVNYLQRQLNITKAVRIKAANKESEIADGA